MGNFVCFVLVFVLSVSVAVPQGLAPNEESTLAFFEQLFSLPKGSDGSAVIRKYVKEINNRTGIYTDEQMADAKREFKRLLPVYIHQKFPDKDSDAEFERFEKAMKGNPGWRALSTLFQST